jgi:hypothetical protein
MNKQAKTHSNFIIYSENVPWFQSANEVQVKQVKEKTVKKPVKSRDSAKSKPEVIYPIFAEASELTEDRFWKSILNDASIGKFPKVFYFVNGTLSYKLKNKIVTVNIDMKNARNALDILCTFMRDRAGILSDIDMIEKNKEQRIRMSIIADVEINSWSQIKCKTHRSILIAKIVSSISNIYDLDKNASSNLEDLIRLGILAGYFNNTTIHVENGYITGIDGLIYNGEGSYNIDTNNIIVKKAPKSRSNTSAFQQYSNEDTNDIYTSTSIKDLPSSNGLDNDDKEFSNNNEKVNFIKLWIKFLKSLEKRLVKNKSKTIPNIEPETN